MSSATMWSTDIGARDDAVAMVTHVTTVPNPGSLNGRPDPMVGRDQLTPLWKKIQNVGNRAEFNRMTPSG